MHQASIPKTHSLPWLFATMRLWEARRQQSDEMKLLVFAELAAASWGEETLWVMLGVLMAL